MGDYAPLRERPGYNANPTDWVRYATYLEQVIQDVRHYIEDAETAHKRNLPTNLSLALNRMRRATRMPLWPDAPGGPYQPGESA